MMKIPIGAFEHDSRKIWFLHLCIFDLVGIENKNKEARYISSTYFYEVLEGLKKRPEPDYGRRISGMKEEKESSSGCALTSKSMVAKSWEL